MSTAMIIPRVNSGKKSKSRRSSSSNSSSLTRGPNAYGPVNMHSLAASKPSGPELKWYDLYNSNVQLYHNASNGAISGEASTPWYLTNFPAQGTSANTRIGDRVNVREIDMRFWLSCKGDRPNCMFRVIIAILPGVATGGSGGLLNYTSGNQYLIAFPASDKATFIYDRIVNPNIEANTIIPTANTPKERSYYHEVKVPVNEVMSVNSTNLCDTSNIAFWVVAYDAYGTLSTDNIASFAAQSRIWFTDA